MSSVPKETRNLRSERFSDMGRARRRWVVELSDKSNCDDDEDDESGSGGVLGGVNATED